MMDVERARRNEGEMGKTKNGCKENKTIIQKVTGLDHKAPSGPDQSGGHEGGILGQRQGLGGAGKVSSAGEDETPLHDGSPEVDRLGADGGVP